MGLERGDASWFVACKAEPLASTDALDEIERVGGKVADNQRKSCTKTFKKMSVRRRFGKSQSGTTGKLIAWSDGPLAQ